MPTYVFVHAHPDDEGTLTCGSMAQAVARGDKVVLVFATSGEHGELPDDLAPGETLADRRRAEATSAAALIGVSAVHWLGYRDSGMTGWEQNADPDCLARAPLDEAAGRLAAILDAEDADILVGYDWHGNYGHPDHVAVHHLVRRARELAAKRPRLFEATMNRDQMRRLYQAARAAGAEDDFDPDSPLDDGNPLGTPEAELHLRVDVSDHVALRRGVIASHASQAKDTQGFLMLPDEAFLAMFGAEHYVEPDAGPGLREGWFTDPLA
ncbi:MAG: PIG-L family deacetylase [Micropruina sp.]|nr:MAG: PIG-L family deacetylase [Micropruina sp.]